MLFYFVNLWCVFPFLMDMICDPFTLGEYDKGVRSTSESNHLCLFSEDARFCLMKTAACNSSIALTVIFENGNGTYCFPNIFS